MIQVVRIRYMSPFCISSGWAKERKDHRDLESIISQKRKKRGIRKKKRGATFNLKRNRINTTNDN